MFRQEYFKEQPLEAIIHYYVNMVIDVCVSKNDSNNSTSVPVSFLSQFDIVDTPWRLHVKGIHPLRISSLASILDRDQISRPGYAKKKKLNSWYKINGKLGGFT